ncbi:NADH-quinone oxidoreductase subunit NuoH [Pseudemcibacter aquimaris]|uniref:NADH-quinone oxidoreductase subunit NuoH n=1 Tax=Pseudemcibacter aquimaris TaxID=2857064 RepID=UPI0020133DD7|nr:NADH-quinone oxidoreductase subunit NuoH [Pseudemcibacter aquimaris]MCC3860862.1 NADH-quinone oxidoreductase subunit NuoH [Pseudemcibacter aquimaris]WDU59680.1 NADH-quinone oxidoreductase subunit NuoH [Pseudemcibacter aquimaris]
MYYFFAEYLGLLEYFDSSTVRFISTLAAVLAVTLPVLIAVAMIVWVDRKVWAAIHLRKGPNIVGPFGLLQSFADGLKVFLKETIIPAGSNKFLFLLAPALSLIFGLVGWAVIPFGEGMVISDLNVGILYLFAISSLEVYGIIIAGWASNSRYAFLGAMRSAAQMVSYEVSIGFVLVCVLMCVGSLNLTDIVLAQQGVGFGIFNGYVFTGLLPMFVIFFVSALAETNRTPFDLPEAEEELVAGFQIEYSSMSMALFYLGEYATIILMCGMMSILFFGGWLPPVDWAPLYAVPGILWLFGKMLFFFFCFAWVKMTVPRYRYDQLMRLGWKVFLPVSLVWVVLTSGYLVFFGKLAG